MVSEPAVPAFQFSLQKLRQATARLQAPSSRERTATVSWVGILLCGIAIGLARVGLGLVSLWKLRRSAVVLASSETVFVVARPLAEELGLAAKSVSLAESDNVGCAAVVGFFRPTILLATDWRDWEPHELRAVLAHEFAHVVRRDALWRFLAVGAGAFHFFHPFVHWLTSRMVLAQELAAIGWRSNQWGRGLMSDRFRGWLFDKTRVRACGLSNCLRLYSQAISSGELKCCEQRIASALRTAVGCHHLSWRHW